ncbi:nucleoside triphosphate pyrophosphohydrolase [Erythrobacteraceae bacterium CFH 75059]|uniref:nucleoside triphosphate pyrophosphohydrolase n=1 Tax=Qipengyuania thermophila TaxID=2509361 RepID=UPI00101F9FA2|nr:nucleoside triphosphate pyrophosphohydrolase [Qipengyuania thermophila]TCD05206.1 nucleoside triphosphate pyrophosphohydrolase [Erythrobacteraceae bacterium CFH 75059]
MSDPVAQLRSIMARLRDPVHGCPWDQQQTFASIAPYTIEEAYEVADAIARDDVADLRGELGDLLLQVIYHAQMAQERGAFTFDDVATDICHKMIRRHPHVFGSEPGAEAPDWEAIKDDERTDTGQTSAMDGVALALPALLRAFKLQTRAARCGFDWPSPDGAKAKIEEELAEFAAAGSDAERQEEAGDVLFSVVNVLRAHGVEPEAALRHANAKFERRFRAVEANADRPLRDMPPDELEALWNAVKREGEAAAS